MEHLHFTFFCCRHAVVLIRHQWARLAPAVAGGELLLDVQDLRTYFHGLILAIRGGKFSTCRMGTSVFRGACACGASWQVTNLPPQI